MAYLYFDSYFFLEGGNADNTNLIVVFSIYVYAHINFLPFPCLFLWIMSVM